MKRTILCILMMFCVSCGSHTRVAETREPKKQEADVSQEFLTFLNQHDQPIMGWPFMAREELLVLHENAIQLTDDYCFVLDSLDLSNMPEGTPGREQIMRHIKKSPQAYKYLGSLDFSDSFNTYVFSSKEEFLKVFAIFVKDGTWLISFTLWNDGIGMFDSISCNRTERNILVRCRRTTDIIDNSTGETPVEYSTVAIGEDGSLVEKKATKQQYETKPYVISSSRR